SCNDPAIFLTCLADALATVMPVGEIVFDQLRAPHPSERAAVIKALATGAYQSDSPFVLAVDDADVLTDAEGIEALSTLADNLPPRYQLAVTGRLEPALGLARWRAERRVLDVGVNDLKFGRHEAGELLAAAGARPTESELDDLVSRTEG